jgi:hypothetical protein
MSGGLYAMYLTHHFPRQSQIARACYWLSQFGFEPTQIEVHTGRDPRISVNVKNLGLAVRAEAIFRAIDTSEPDSDGESSDGMFDLSKWTGPPDSGAMPSPLKACCSEIGWHPLD